uniref:Uncharacterized protein n=1 Tax=Romanomermis culicivorax TaxID=13658 RepID=A0A915IG06_ROMCU
MTASIEFPIIENPYTPKMPIKLPLDENWSIKNQEALKQDGRIPEKFSRNSRWIKALQQKVSRKYLFFGIVPIAH